MWFRHDGAAAHCGKNIPLVVERDIFKKAAWTWRTVCMAPSVAGFLLLGRLKEQVYALPPRTIEDLVARLQAAVATVDTNMLRRVQVNVVRLTAVCLEAGGGRFNTYCNYEVPMLQTFDSLRRMTVPMKWANNIFCTSRFKINITVKWYKL
jgi:hypothetical protein